MIVGNCCKEVRITKLQALISCSADQKQWLISRCFHRLQTLIWFLLSFMMIPFWKSKCKRIMEQIQRALPFAFFLLITLVNSHPCFGRIFRFRLFVSVFA